MIFALYSQMNQKEKVLEESKCGNMVTIGDLHKGHTRVCRIALLTFL